ncbi:MAG TPA: bifunctional adenosylcobinamide kinase/adenosylcobinamide-phosphate guanylyltransferase [Cyanobacteria bacterium UBA11149]|nr:bifunctional adenosylcobinamide kinase/adenosylcobinamide-phosphate guanylyltransferase [Cyanobacteria bacterium UBA11367]HBE58827.1 bifunctional adenosylcobinamide kinase/adenosylcobinamide-phosphate guanylyltransferase [Cyanobacteria bacterium UBA11366]HBK63461.1 bifunctional adenosylcobinamide kinase/adenosylcobinamide-phosphate guanylyltransferase [Cyanobacteria bacterium UBA11166]HBR73381.1 bifunctional adenosylcobinamide kinase/adenosylcobinamide-phosphate guanylyltransferase [Cyanobact
MYKIILVTGPARCGKSEWAESLAIQTGKEVFYLATAQTDPQDIEWLARIEKHAQRRPAEWQTLLVPVELAAKIRDCDRANCCLLVDSLGTWVANCLDFDEETWEQTTIELLESLTQTAATAILVAEETGWGVVPAYPIGRKFRDRLGQLVRQLGAIANPVYLITGGHILNLSTLGVPLQIQGGK